MEPVNIGAWSLLPPLVVIAAALLARDVVAALLLGILSGTLLHSLAVGRDPVAAPVETAFRLMADTADLDILIFLALMGALVAVIHATGGTRAYGKWAAKRLHSPRSAVLATGGLGILIFIDDYFNCLTVGTVMRPVTDKYHISRAKLAYIIDATAAPVCMLVPLSSWAAAAGVSLQGAGIEGNGNTISALVATIPYNIYAVLSLALVLLLCLYRWDFGPMAREERDAGEKTEGDAEEESCVPEGRVADLLVPMAALIAFSFLAMLYTGGFWEKGEYFLVFTAALANCNAARSLAMGAFWALLAAFLLFVPRRLIGFRRFMQEITEGVRSMATACIILLLAWTMGGVCRDLLSTGEYVGGLLAAGAIPGQIMPLMVFLSAGILAFSMGTAWGTFGLLLPLVAPVCTDMAPEQLTTSLAAVLAGSVFGDHCSPISDTTILSASGAGCEHLRHVSTQLPYALTTAACCVPGYLMAGFFPGVPWAPLIISLILLVLSTLLLHRLSVRRVENTC